MPQLIADMHVVRNDKAFIVFMNLARNPVNVLLALRIRYLLGVQKVNIMFERIIRRHEPGILEQEVADSLAAFAPGPEQPVKLDIRLCAIEFEACFEDIMSLSTGRFARYFFFA